MSDLRRTPLYEAHRAAGAKLVPFAGWEMPVQYTGIMDEHKAVRTGAGVFDVSHMGEIVFRGPRAAEAVQKLMTNSVTNLDKGSARYTVMCYADGGIVDDCIVYRRGPEVFLVVVNASNIAKDFAWMREQAGEMCDIDDESDATALMAVQGPKAVEIVARLAGEDLGTAIKPFQFMGVRIAEKRAVAARTGYTGEDGFEIFTPAGDARAVWDALLAEGVKPIGLGARDTLRLEARLCLYGNDIDQTTSPLEAGLGWVVKLDNDFVGKEALLEQKAKGVVRKLIGFAVKGRGIARHDYPILDASGAQIGKVTSGTTSPTLGYAIGMGYVPTAQAEPGTRLVVDCRGKPADIELVKGPFYKRSQA
jgi:aminomethyltransferase